MHLGANLYCTLLGDGTENDTVFEAEVGGVFDGIVKML